MNIFTDVIGAVFEVAAEKRNFSSKKFPTTVSLADSEYASYIYHIMLYLNFRVCIIYLS
jgi:hypothetical protein